MDENKDELDVADCLDGEEDEGLKASELANRVIKRKEAFILPASLSFESYRLSWKLWDTGGCCVARGLFLSAFDDDGGAGWHLRR